MYNPNNQNPLREMVWQRGEQLITYGPPRFHPFCVKCNRPADYVVECYNPEAGGGNLVADVVAGVVSGALSVAVSFLLTLLTAFFLSVTVFFPPNDIQLGLRIPIPLCESHQFQRIVPKIIGTPLIILGFLLGLAFMADLLYFFSSNRQFINNPLYWIAFFGLLSGGTMLYQKGNTSLKIASDQSYYYIQGVCQAYRNRFPSA